MKRYLMTVVVTLVFTSAALAQNAMQQKIDSLGATLGAAVGQERRVAGGGRVREFEKGAIFWSRSTGARVVGSTALEKYKELGAETGALGYPVSDEQATDGVLRQIFEHGLLTTTATGEVQATILPGVTFGESSLTVATASPVTLELDPIGFLNVRDMTGPEITLSCSCEEQPSGMSQRAGFCTVAVRNGNKTAFCKKNTCRGSCEFEIVSK